MNKSKSKIFICLSCKNNPNKTKTIKNPLSYFLICHTIFNLEEI